MLTHVMPIFQNVRLAHPHTCVHAVTYMCTCSYIHIHACNVHTGNENICWKSVLRDRKTNICSQETQNERQSSVSCMRNYITRKIRVHVSSGFVSSFSAILIEYFKNVFHATILYTQLPFWCTTTPYRCIWGSKQK